MTKKIAVFYLSRSASLDTWPVVVANRSASPPPVAYVRAQVVEARSLSDALDKARPRRGEVVMNTHYV